MPAQWTIATSDTRALVADLHRTYLTNPTPALCPTFWDFQPPPAELFAAVTQTISMLAELDRSGGKMSLVGLGLGSVKQAVTALGSYYSDVVGGRKVLVRGEQEEVVKEVVRRLAEIKELVNEEK